MKVTSGQEIGTLDGRMLECPYCHCLYLHQGRVEVFNRSMEDSAEGLHVTIEGQEIVTNRRMHRNPSSRRQGLIINFECEECDAKILMLISQHKGNTWVNYVRA